MMRQSAALRKPMNANARDFFYESADGLRLYCALRAAQHPDGLPVLCLPGLTRNSRDFDALAARWSWQHEVLAADLRGRGRSAWDSDPMRYELSTYVRDAWTLLDSRRIDRFVVIGTSLGGLMAMTMAAMEPRRAAGVVLNDIGPEIDPTGLRRIAGYVGRLPAVNNWDEAIAQTKSVYGPALPGLTDDQWSDYAHRGYRENDNGIPVPDMDPGIAEVFRRPPAGDRDPWPLFRRLTAVPMLVIRGGSSDILSLDTLNRMIREKPDLSHVTIAQRGHAPLLDEPECLIAIDRFLMRHGQRS
jgi:pimeloyl-ACP methyl ester carboxylesterase